MGLTRKEAKELLPIIKAYAEGKHIQWINHCKKWIDVDERSGIHIEWSSDNYRIKPTYRPFRTQEECWNEMHKHPDFGWLYYKEKGYYVNINAMGDRVGMNGQKFVEAYSDYTFTDGEPFGVKEE